MKRQWANSATTTLNGAINNAVTSLVVTSASLFPTAGYFSIVIDSEILLVKSVSGSTFTVVRGQEGSTAASHSDGATVYEYVTAADINSIYPVFKMKSADEAVATSTALQNDDHLLFGVSTGETWTVELRVIMTAGTAADLNWAWSVPSGSCGMHGKLGYDVGAAAAAANLNALGSTSLTAPLVAGGLGTGTVSFVNIFALIETGSNTGNVQWQWGPAALSTANPTTVKARSYLLANLVA